MGSKIYTACKIDQSQHAYVHKLYYENVILLTFLSVNWLKMYFPFQNQARNHMENINVERTLCHYVILQILQDFGLYS